MIIVDYGTGNLGSVVNMLKRIGVDGSVSSDPAVIAEADKLILPGVGAFDTGMQHLNERGLIEPLTHAAQERRVPVLGFCLGMQLLSGSSEEGQLAGLNWIPGRCVRITPSNDLRVPHMGWNRLDVHREHPLLAAMEPALALLLRAHLPRRVRGRCRPRRDHRLRRTGHGCHRPRQHLGHAVPSGEEPQVRHASVVRVRIGSRCGRRDRTALIIRLRRSRLPEVARPVADSSERPQGVDPDGNEQARARDDGNTSRGDLLEHARNEERQTRHEHHLP